MKKSLLIIGCSGAKKETCALIPAFELFTENFFKI